MTKHTNLSEGLVAFYSMEKDSVMQTALLKKVADKTITQEDVNYILSNVKTSVFETDSFDKETDCRIVISRVFSDLNLSLTFKEAYDFWKNHSYDRFAGWLIISDRDNIGNIFYEYLKRTIGRSL